MASGSQPYWMAEDCPNCGQKDAVNQWKGARTSGGKGVAHKFSCCSTACLIAFNDSPKRYERERQAALRVREAINVEIARLDEIIGRLKQ